MRRWWIADDGGLVFDDRSSRRSGEREWLSVPTLLRGHEESCSVAWTTETDAVEALRERAVPAKPHVKGLRRERPTRAGTAGPVRSSAGRTDAYDPRRLREIEQQGKIAPRMLDLEQSRTATRNRKDMSDAQRTLERTLPFARA